MARTDGVFVNKTKRQHKDGTQRGEDSGGRGRGKYQKLERQIEKKTAKNQQRFGSQGNSNSNSKFKSKSKPKSNSKRRN